MTELGAFKRTKLLYISVLRVASGPRVKLACRKSAVTSPHPARHPPTGGLRVASGPRVKLAGCKNALNPSVVYSTDRFKAVVPVLVLFFVALWFILRGDLLYVFPCVILFLCLNIDRKSRFCFVHFKKRMNS